MNPTRGSSDPAAWVREDILSLNAYHVPSAAGMVKLDAMENPYQLPEDVRSELKALVEATPLNRYPDPKAPELSARLRQVFSIGAEFGLILGNGSDEIITLIAQALAKPGAVMLAPEPSFAMYKMNAVYSGLRYVGVPLRPNFELDLEAMVGAIEAHRPAVTFIAYPNNPTGNAFDEDAIEAILKASKGLVVLDEAYHAFAGRSFMDRLTEHDNLLVMRTVSKLGLAGIRLGYAAASPGWIEQLDKLRPPYNINVLTQVVATHLLSRVQVLTDQAERIRADRARLFEGLAKLEGVQAFPSQANFILARVPNAAAVHAALLERKVLVRNLHGGHPLLSNCLRFTVGTPQENHTLLNALAGSLQSSGT